MTSPSSGLSPSSSSSSSSLSMETKDLAKKGGKILGVALIVVVSAVAIAALAIGIAALVNPAGLALVGTSVGLGVTAMLALAAENALPVLIVGAVGVGLLAITGVITLIYKGCK